MTFDLSAFERGTLVYPQPIAVACDRVRRAKTPQEQLDAILKCAEVVTRYIAAVSLTSFFARADASIAPSPKLASFNGPLSFGNFLHAIRDSHDGGCEHPLRDLLREAFLGRIKQVFQADACLTKLRELRNVLGHNLMSMNEARAISILEQSKPAETLIQALQRLEPVLSLPLFLVDDQQLIGGKIVAQRLLLMGASADPLPELAELSAGLIHKRHPYLGYAGGVLDLSPFLIWDIVPNKGNFGLYIIHEIAARDVIYQTVNDDERQGGATAREEVRQRMEGSFVAPCERVAPVGPTSFLDEWLERRRVIEQSSVSPIPWFELDIVTLRWYGQRLGAKSDDDSLRRTLREQLLDGREYLRGEELRQVVLLFGRAEVIQRQIGRRVIDLRATTDPGKRWDERVERATNVIESLREAVVFFGRHVAAAGGLTIEGLTATSGTADYIAMREALVNLFIHQDYGDPRTSGQVEIGPGRTRFFNAGNSLVGKEALAEGGTSQARNPLISRALKLIGFAELAGSGLRQVYYAWGQAHRHPPEIASDQMSNTFSLTLDWRPIPVVVDTFWKKHIGFTMTAEHAAIVMMASEPDGVAIETVAASQGVPLNVARTRVQYLATNLMVVLQPDGRVILHETRREAIEAAKAQSASAEQ